MKSTSPLPGMTGRITPKSLAPGDLINFFLVLNLALPKELLYHHVLDVDFHGPFKPDHVEPGPTPRSSITGKSPVANSFGMRNLTAKP